jgi:hypothetical protein
MSAIPTAPPPQSPTVTIRVQVIDLRSFTLDLQVPSYLPASDLTQRIARDAGLDAFWPDGRRRQYYLRARGHLLAAHERLSDLGVQQGELVYLLPEPPPSSGIVEREPELPAVRGYVGHGVPALVLSIGMVLVWSAGWGAALVVSRSAAVLLLPALGLGMLSTSLSRHAWGGEGSRLRVAVTGFLLFVVLAVLAFAAPLLWKVTSPAETVAVALAGLVTGIVGVLVGWLAWWGAVEPLPAAPAAQPAASTAATTARPAEVRCAICGLPVAAEVLTPCPRNCGRSFHAGCYKARLSVYRGDPTVCGLCGQSVG